jgi:hypothetical protein
MILHRKRLCWIRGAGAGFNTMQKMAGQPRFVVVELTKIQLVAFSGCNVATVSGDSEDHPVKKGD